MTEKEVLQFRFTLEQELAALDLRSRGREILEISNEADPLDVTQSAAARDFEAGNISRIAAKVRQIREAINRIHDGSYGECLRCEEPIPVKRLNAVPWAIYCVRCQEIVDRDRHEHDDGTESDRAAA
ncbi:MAG: TraR/DksA family transcriptional regulator [Bryobacterales bacterium]|nr:TraR/DksA family transcriptional regulator [Bryobacterales bacterium]